MDFEGLITFGDRGTWKAPKCLRVLLRNVHERPTFYKSVKKEPCVYCGGKSAGMDHIQPKSKGGADHWQNRAPACTECDRRKSSWPMLLWLVTLRECGNNQTKAHEKLTKAERMRRALEEHHRAAWRDIA
jgi:5-methylcytosine-specific restriction endonuclease McrA